MQLGSNEMHTTRPGRVGIDEDLMKIALVIRLAEVDIRQEILGPGMGSRYVLEAPLPISRPLGLGEAGQGTTGQRRTRLGDLVPERTPGGRGVRYGDNDRYSDSDRSHRVHSLVPFLARPSAHSQPRSQTPRGEGETWEQVVELQRSLS